VTSRIKQIRHAVGDDGRTQVVLRTVHSRGYQFIADLSAAEPVPPTAEPVQPAAVDRGLVRYANSDGLSIAYQITGTGERDIVLIPGFISHLEFDWAEPRHAHFLERLASFGRLIRFDKRGTGMSDRPHGIPDLDERMHDVLAVMDTVGSRRAVLFGYSEGGPLSVLFAAAHPERVESLVIYGSYARRLRAPDYPWAQTPEERRVYAERLSSEWSFEADMHRMCPSADEAMARWFGQRARAAATPSTVKALIEMNSLVDIRAVLATVRVPALVLHRRGDLDSNVEEGRYLADRMPNARFVELAGIDHFVAINPDQILDEMEAFLRDTTDQAHGRSYALAAILAGPVPPSLAGEGRAAGRAARTRSGESVLLFDGPATAVRTGLGLLKMGIPSGLGLHVAEVSTSDGFVEGVGADVAVALAAAATPGELWLTPVVKDLLATSGLAVQACAERALADGPAQQIYRAVP
jgi:pimeloyl-ACP methyl ester carboxylesterase